MCGDLFPLLSLFGEGAVAARGGDKLITEDPDFFFSGDVSYGLKLTAEDRDDGGLVLGVL